MAISQVTEKMSLGSPQKIPELSLSTWNMYSFDGLNITALGSTWQFTTDNQVRCPNVWSGKWKMISDDTIEIDGIDNEHPNEWTTYLVFITDSYFISLMNGKMCWAGIRA
jgi:hypothetical protein